MLSVGFESSEQSEIEEDPGMAAHLLINGKLVDRALELSGEETEAAAVNLALREFIARREQVSLLDLFDALEWDAAFDYKAERSSCAFDRASQSTSAPVP